jgi:hypothetical protein
MPRASVLSSHAGRLDFMAEPCHPPGMKSIRRFFNRFRDPVGIPLGVNVPADPADHAEDFAHRYAEPLDWQAGMHMEEMGIPSERIGSNDHARGLAGRAFNPHERSGGGISPGGRINLDSGSFNPELLTKDYGKRAGKLWAQSRLRHRWEALEAHKDAEWRMGGDHDAAVRVAPETELPISDKARKILREMRKGWKGR